MGRFLIFFSYLGNRYSGLQSQTRIIVRGKPILTVQDALMDALKRLEPANEVRATLSSRTDKGVHAFKNSCHVDLQYPSEGKEYQPEVITHVMNHYLKRSDHEVRVLETKRVHDDFHARLHARYRKYVYRIGHRVKSGHTASDGDVGRDLLLDSEEALHDELKKYAQKRTRRAKFTHAPYGDMATPLDTNKIIIQRCQLDVNKMLAAAELLSGIHDFSAFTPPTRLDGTVHPLKMLTIGVRRGQPMAGRLQRGLGTHLHDLEFWDIHIQARSFLYKMVRRLVGTILLHARNEVSLEEIRDILDHPRHNHWFFNKTCMPEDGLFLEEVHYDPRDLKFPMADPYKTKTHEMETVCEENLTESDSEEVLCPNKALDSDEQHESVATR